MAELIASTRMTKLILDALGVNHGHVCKVTLTVEPMQVPTVNVSYYVDMDMATNLAKVIRKPV